MKTIPEAIRDQYMKYRGVFLEQAKELHGIPTVINDADIIDTLDRAAIDSRKRKMRINFEREIKERRVINLPKDAKFSETDALSWERIDYTYTYYAELLNATTIKFPYKLTIR